MILNHLVKPTLEFLKAKFSEFNVRIFGGRLPEIPLALCEVSSFVGQYKRHGNSHLLRFSTAFDLSERELEDTIIHEMIHYFIAYNGLYDRSAHGPLFKAMMNSINEAHDRNITVSRRTTHGEMLDAKTAKKKWHVIAILHFSTGEKGVKVLPRVIPKILEYHRSLSAASNIRQIDLYLHNASWFNRFPTSVARRCHAITDVEIKEHLAGAHRLTVKGGKLIQQ